MASRLPTSRTLPKPEEGGYWAWGWPLPAKEGSRRPGVVKGRGWVQVRGVLAEMLPLLFLGAWALGATVDSAMFSWVDFKARTLLWPTAATPNVLPRPVSPISGRPSPDHT